MYKHDFICLSETYLDFSTPDRLHEINEYILDRADLPNNIKRDVVCIYYKESLPVRVINLFYLNEALLLEMAYNNKELVVLVVYRFPSHNNSEFGLFFSNFKKFVSDIN